MDKEGNALRNRLIWLGVYAAAMAFVESAVVVYLRWIYYPGGFRFPITIIPDRMTAIEVGREAATILMLIAVAALAGAGRWEKFLCFCIAFGVWDIFYYVWLRLLLGWPESLLTWDILFLMPVPWLGPVLAPVIVSIGLIAGPLWLLLLRARGATLRFSSGLWAMAVIGGALVLLSFTLDYDVVLEGLQPRPFRWWLFGAGAGLATLALVLGARACKPAA